MPARKLADRPQKAPNASCPSQNSNQTRKSCSFFCRGRGRGHAIPDIEIVRELPERRDDIDLRFVSYSTGARTLEEAGYKLIELALPEGGAAAEMTAVSGKLIGWLKPDLVVSHEEFAPLPVAKIFNRRPVFVIDWFIEADTYAMNCLKFADEIPILHSQGLHEEPAYLKGRVNYLGRMRRKFACTKEDRADCRSELGLAPGLDSRAIEHPAALPVEDDPILVMVIRSLQVPVIRIVPPA